jgi:16S rRNA (adenine1518-N6/adenine1519-N6)-dimethyltransferase
MPSDPRFTESHAMSRNQTLSYLVRRFQEVGIRPATRQGQNFLIDNNLQRLLVDTAAVGPRDVVLEVGTGTGALTALIAERAAAVVTVEISQHLYELASEELIHAENVTMLRQDALASKNRTDQRVIDAVQQQLDAARDRQWKLVANLPFNVATPVLANLLSCSIVPTTMTATIQKELADRITARPSTKPYGALSVWIQSQCRTKIIRVLPPTVFWPRPKVLSAIIQVTVDRQRRRRIANLTYWHHFVRAMFLHRRKFLRSVMCSAFKRHLSKSDVDHVLQGLALGPDTRAEQLDVEKMLVLCEAVRAQAPNWRL